ncbi:MAG: AtpZ/AtpI family protein [Cocleimonas sp.]
MKKEKPATTGIFQIGAGNMLASMVIAGFFLGYLVDQWLDKTPIFMLSFGALGLVGGMKRVHELLTYENKNNERDGETLNLDKTDGGSSKSE